MGGVFGFAAMTVAAIVGYGCLLLGRLSGLAKACGDDSRHDLLGIIAITLLLASQAVAAAGGVMLWGTAP